MITIKESTIFDIRDANNKSAYLVTVTDDSVEIETLAGLGIKEFIKTFSELTRSLQLKYEHY